MTTTQPRGPLLHGDALEDLPDFETLERYLAHWASNRPAQIAFSSDDVSYTYKDVQREVDRVAGALRRLGATGGDVIAAFSWSRPQTFIIFLACCRIGAIFLGLSPRSSESELTYILNDANAKVVLDLHLGEPSQHEALIAAVDGTGSICLAIGDGFKPDVDRREALSLDEFAVLSSRYDAHEQAAAEINDDGPTRPAALVYTSGSTGKPKGALLSEKGMIRTGLLSWKYWYGALNAPRSVAQHPINHCGWLVCEGVSSVVAGGFLYFRERFDGGETLKLIERERLNLWLAFPSMVMLAMKSPEFSSADLSSLRRVALGSASSVEMIEAFQVRSTATFSVSYGLTEAHGGAVCSTDQDADPATVASTIGRPVPGIELRLDIPEGASEGEILIRDPSVFLGYLNLPVATAEAIDADGWLHTGDIAQVDDRGIMTLVGRTKEMFKSGGYNVYPTEIENYASLHPQVREVAVVSAPDPMWGEVGNAYVVAGSGTEIDPEELRNYLRNGLANYKVPKRIVLVPELPRLPNGKVDKITLRKGRTVKPPMKGIQT